MRRILSILFCVVLLAAGCSSLNVNGLYHSDDCDNDSPNCFQYNFHTDGSFSYWYTNEIFGEFIVSGNYYYIGKRLKLFPVSYIFHDTTHIEYQPRHSKDSISIRISLLPGHFKNCSDTMQVPWLIRVNGDRYFNDSDDYGVYTVKADSIYRIDLKEYSAKFYMDSEMPEADTTFLPRDTHSDIHIYLASSVLEPIVIPPASEFRILGKGAVLQSLDTVDTGYWKHTTHRYVR